MGEVPRRRLGVFAHRRGPGRSSGGTLACPLPGGCEGEVPLCTDDGSVDAPADSGEAADRPPDEGRRGRDLLGVSSLGDLGRADGEPGTDLASRGEIGAVIRRLGSDGLVAPDPLAVVSRTGHDTRRGHRTLGWAAPGAPAPVAAASRRLPGIGPLHQVATVPVSGSLEPAVLVGTAVICHETRLEDVSGRFPPAPCHRARDAGPRAGLSLAGTCRRVLT